MSWMQSQQQQGPPPPATQTSPPAAVFSGQQQWQQQNYTNQPPAQLQNQSNWYNPASLPQGNVRTPSQNWQRHSIQQSQQTSAYFGKPQLPPAVDNFVQSQPPSVDNFVQSQPPSVDNLVQSQPPSVDNFMQSQQAQPPHQQQYKQQLQQLPFQTASYQQTQSRQSSVVQANGPVNSTQFLKSEPMSRNTQGIEAFDNQTGEGWGEWDWNDNNQLRQSSRGTDISLNNMNPNSIEDSFKSEPNDNWQWNVEEKPTITLPGESKRRIENKLDALSNIGYDVRPEAFDNNSSTQPTTNVPSPKLEDQHYNPLVQQQPISLPQSSSPISAYNQHQVSVQSIKLPTNQQTVHSVPVSTQQQKRNQQIVAQETCSLENIQPSSPINMYLQGTKSAENTNSVSSSAPVQSSKPVDNAQNSVGSPVYVSQAKPVSQPPRQYAISPSASGESTPILQNNQAPAFPNVAKIPPQGVNDQAFIPPVSSIGNAQLSHPVNSQSPGLSNLPPPPPPPSQTPPQSSGSNSILPPPPQIAQNTGPSNPYKRTGVVQHHRGLAPIPKNTQHPAMGSQFYTPPPEEFQSQQNQEYLAPDNSEIVDRNSEVENQEVAPSNDRNRYLQTSHLSEEGYNNNRQDAGIAQDQNNEFDSFPPPGLSRLVLGQPEIESQQRFVSQPDIPPGLDRMIPGTELVASNLNMERQADGQDTIPSPRSAFANVLPVDENAAENIDITADRNLYLVPGESDVQEQRVVTGLENGSINQEGELREVELDGENLEDQQQQLQLQQQHSTYQHEVEITRDEPLEGANTLDGLAIQSTNHETESSLTVETNLKDLSNASTGNDESDQRDRHNVYVGKSKRAEEKKRRPEANIDKRKERYESEESDLSSERERRRYREGSVRNDRGRESKERDRKERRESRERDNYRDDKDRDDRRYDRDRHRDKYERERGDRGRYDRNRYETDSKYETESSTRYERRRTDKNGDRDRDRDRYENEFRRDEKERRYRRERRSDDRDVRERDRRRGDRDYRNDRDRRRERDIHEKNRSDYDEEYRKNRSEKDRLREKDPRYSHMYNYTSGFSYDMYYQHQKYYEQLRRTNPQAYAEWYHNYYAQMQGDLTANDGRESVHSGRSSANNDKERYSIQAVRQYLQQPSDYRTTMNSSMIGEPSYNLSSGLSTGNLSQHHQQHTMPSGYIMPSTGRSYYAQSEYSETTRNDNLSLNLMDESSSIQDPHRETPYKFSTEHATVSCSAGIFVCVKPKYSPNGITNIVKILKFGAYDSTRRLFQSFPGPLVRGVTHKTTLIEFCEDQIRLGPPSITLRSRQNSISSISSIGQTNKASFTLMWKLLILLLRQNGVVVGTDIAELLMKNKLQFPYEPQSYTSKSSNVSRRDSVQSDIKKSKDNTPCVDENDQDTSEHSIEHASDELETKIILSEGEVTEKFRNYLLYGNVNEALEWAADNNLWGHALFLASKLDRRSHANVMMKFANKLALNDPLQTLYQLLSGRSPSSVTSIQDEKWGDWRPHLAMILSNTSQKPELNHKAITTLGDSLYNRSDLFGAQFCYLMAQVEFGRYSSINQDTALMPNSPNAIRLVLLGSSQQNNFKEFATNEAIMMTEIYEYACSLNDDKFSILEFQPYKYLLALRMLDYGLQLKTLMYMEQISIHIQRDPSKYEPSFIEKIYNLADRLKFYDPVLEKTMDDHQNIESNENWSYQGQQQYGVQFEDQTWIQDLRKVLNENCINSPNNNNNVVYGYNTEQMAQLPSAEVDNNKALIDQQFSEINQQFSELTMQYNNFDPIQQTSGYQTGTDVQYKMQQQQQQQQPPPIPNQVPDGQQSGDQYGQYYNPNSSFHSGLPQTISGQDSGQGYGNVVTPGGYIQPQQTSYDQQHQMQGMVIDNQQPNQSYDYWEQQQQLQQQQQQQTEIQRPTISMPNSLSNKPGFYDDTSKDENSLKSNQGNEQKQMNAVKNQSKSAATANNSGWFGGIWNKLSLKPKNQMILPDDKNPSIVWDADQKKWVNTEGNDTEQESFKPPPKMSDIMPGQNSLSQNNMQNPGPNMMQQNTQHSQQILQQQQPPQQPPQQQPQQQIQQSQQIPYGGQIQEAIPAAAIPQPSPSPVSAIVANGSSRAPVEVTKIPNLQSNMFKMQRNRTLKNSYVDVFNPSGAQPSKPIEPVLAPAVPPAAVPQSGFFIPGPVSTADDSQQQQGGPPQFYNPNQFSGYQQ